MPGDRDAGYALVAAVTAVAAFAYIAFQALAADQGEVLAVTAASEHARLAADADAGLAIAVHALAADDPAQRWAIDGSSHEVAFGRADLTIVVTDERGKAPLAGLTEGQSRALFEGAGASGDRLDALVDEYRDWQEQALQDPRSSAPDPTAAEWAPGYQARRGAFRTVGELMGLRDMDAALYRRIAPAVTVFFEESGPFEPKNAQPLAIEAMSGLDAAGQDTTVADDPSTGARPAEDIADDSLIGRTLTVDVVAREAGRRTHRMAIVELTGSKSQPYWVRYVE